MIILSHIHNFIRHNKICIAISQKIKWDAFKLVVINFFNHLYMRKHHCIFQSNSMHSIIYLPYYEKDLIQRTIVNTKKYYEYSVLDFICNKWNDGKIGKTICGNSFIDVGSNIGNHTLFFFNECHAASSYNFEPITDTFKILNRNIELNKLTDKAHLFNAALGSRKGFATLIHYDPKNIGMAQLSNDENGEFQVFALDDFNIQDNIKLIKIDVEGFEFQVISGMVNTIKKYKPFIMIEIQNKFLSEIDNILTKLNYKKYKINEDTNLANYLYYQD